MSENNQDSDYRIIARATLDQLHKEQERAQAYANELAKWMLATLTIVNGGAIVALLQGGPTGISALKVSGIWFVLGIVAAIGSGLAAWVNAGIRDIAYSDMADTNMIISRDHWPSPDKKTDYRIVLTYWIALLVGLISVVLFCVGAACVKSALV